MRVKDLVELLVNLNPESKVLVRIDGSIFPTDTKEEHSDYNDSTEEFFVLAVEEFGENDDG